MYISETFFSVDGYTTESENVALNAVQGSRLDFKTGAYMQVTSFALEIHIKNLIATFGPDVVADVYNRIVK